MRERPILFSQWSVERILAGAKNQTRRVLAEPGWAVEGDSELEIDEYGKPICIAAESGCFAEIPCPYGVVGDRLWVREPWRVGKVHNERSGTELWEHMKERGQGTTVLYGAGGWKSVAPFYRPEPNYPDNEPMPGWAGKRRNAMFMPRWASRITLEITDIRVQRVQQISEEDAIAEGCEATDYTAKDIKDIQISDASPDIKELARILGPGRFTAKDRYMTVWDEINGKTRPWISNPWVWALSFRRLEANEAQS